MIRTSSSPASDINVFNPRTVENCPDFDERMTLVDGKTRAVAYPNKGWNCSKEWSI